MRGIKCFPCPLFFYIDKMDFQEEEGFPCLGCGRKFKYELSFRRHFDSCQAIIARGGYTGRYKCPHCSSFFSRDFTRQRHIQRVHVESACLFSCGICDRAFATKPELHRHRDDVHVRETKFVLMHSAHRKQAQQFRLFFPDNIVSLEDGLLFANVEVNKLMESMLVFQKHFKTNLFLMLELYKTDEQGNVSHIESFPFRGSGFSVHPFCDFKQDVALALGDIERTVDEFLYQGSGWRIMGPLFFDVQTLECPPLAGGGGGGGGGERREGGCGIHVAKVVKKKGITVDEDTLNREGNLDGKCIYYAIASHFVRTRGGGDLDQFVTRRGFPAGLDVKVKDIDKIENDKSWGKDLDLAINIIYKDADGTLLPVRASKKCDAKNVVVLLLFHFCCSSQEAMHYAYVVHPDKMFRERKQDAKGKFQSRQYFPCWNCLTCQSTYVGHQHHLKFCLDNDAQRVQLPPEGSVITFSERNADEGEKSLSRKVFNSAYMLFFDCETLQVKTRRPCSCSDEVLENTRKYMEERAEWEKMSEEEKSEIAADLCMDAASSDEEREVEMLERNALYETLGPVQLQIGKKRKKKRMALKSKQKVRKVKICHHKTKVIYEQEAFMCSYILVTREGVVVTERTIQGENCMEVFLEDVIALSKKYLPSLSPGLPLILTSEERDRLKLTQTCYLCQKEMLQDKVLDHDHLTGRLLGVAHNECNLKRREAQVLTVYCHNFAGFDSHLLIREIGKRKDIISSVSAIPLNTQKFKCLTVNNKIRFLDSLAFLPDSLAKLTNNLRCSGCNFTLLNDMCNNEEEKKLLLRKGIFPYGFATSEERLLNTTVLPSMKDFYNELDGSEISEEEYAHAATVWETFRPQNVMQYAVLYCKLDVRLLAEAVLDFREKIWQEFGLDMNAYLSTPMISKDMVRLRKC